MHRSSSLFPFTEKRFQVERGHRVELCGLASAFHFDLLKGQQSRKDFGRRRRVPEECPIDAVYAG